MTRASTVPLWVVETADAVSKAVRWSPRNGRWRRLPYSLRPVGSTCIVIDRDYRPIGQVPPAAYAELRAAGVINERGYFFDDQTAPWHSRKNRPRYLAAVRRMLALTNTNNA